MKTFLSEVVQGILEGKEALVDTICVLPSERAGVFLKQEFKNQISFATFLPQILSIESFIESVSEHKKEETVTLLFEFYTTYLKNNQNSKEDFDSFSQWATIALQDFNEVDRHLVNAEELFSYLRDIKRIENWDLEPNEPISDVISNHLSFMDKLGDSYMKFYQYLKEKKKGYQGLLYREAANSIEDYIEKNKKKRIIFIGFNALNKAEEYIFQKLIESGIGTIIWDADSYYMDSNKEAGAFLRKYKSQWRYYEKEPFQAISNNFLKKPIITEIAAPKNISQIKYVGELLSKKHDFEKTALVLADESLLSIVLNSLPTNVEKLNITMGYAMKDMPIAGLFHVIFELYLNQEKLGKVKEQAFYYKDIERLLQHPFFIKLFGNQEEIKTFKHYFIQNNQVFIALDEIQKVISNAAQNSLVLELFQMSQNVAQFISKAILFIEMNKDNFEGYEKECLFRYYNLFLQLQNLNGDFQHIQSLKTLYAVYKQLIASETLSFQGEPLNGLQLMGMLETRVLDFETVIITSMNEGILPASKNENSFIPFDVKKEYGLPTYQEKDAIFSYHFYRLIQRAKQVYLLYNTETDAYGSGEKSRFLTQLEIDNFKLNKQNIIPKIVSQESKILEVEKTPRVIDSLKKIAAKGFSPSALSTYVLDPIQYYKQYLLKIKDLDEVEETVAANTMGTVVHDVLDAFYRSFEGKYVVEDDVKKMISLTEEKTRYFFQKHYKKGILEVGKNKLIFKVAENFILNFLKLELKQLQQGKKLKIIGVEKEITVPISIDGLDFPIQIKGTVDRIDELDGVVRIVDYKTGKVETNQLKINDFCKVTEDYKYTKALQVMLYAFLYTSHNKHIFEKKLEAGIFSFRNLKSDFIRMDFAKGRTKDYEITQERIEEFMYIIKQMIVEIFDIEKPFIENTNRPF